MSSRQTSGGTSDRTHRNALQPGHLLHWYRIERVLGQGGFGITYLAQDTNLEQPMAIKEFLPMEMAVREGDHSVHPASADLDSRFRWGLERFLAEARTLARFRHPSIVRVLSVFEANNTAYMVMEYEQGDTLHDRLATGTRTLPEPALRSLLYPLLDGLEAVHAAGFIHRDIKPTNIIIRGNGTPALIDFGSARQAIGQQTRTLTSIVSPGYAPYEQYLSQSDRQGPWSDIYSLAATLYRAIAGRAPLDAIDRSEGRLTAERDLYVHAVELGEGKYSRDFLRTIDHGMSFKAADRPQTVAAWRREFDGAAPEPITEAASASAFVDRMTPAVDTAAATVRIEESSQAPITYAPAVARATSSGSKRAVMTGLVSVLIVLLGAYGAWRILVSHQPGANGKIAQVAPVPPAQESAMPPPADAVAVVEPAPAPAPVVAAPVAVETAPPPSPPTAAVVAAQPPAAVLPAVIETTPAAAPPEDAAPVPSPQVAPAPVPTPSAPESPPLQPSTATAVTTDEPAPVDSTEKQVETLLAQADEDLHANRLTSPKGANALARYQEALQIDAANSRASAGVAAVARRYADLARSSLAGGNIDAAQTYVERGHGIRPDLTEWGELRSAIDSAREEQQRAAATAAAAAAKKAAAAPAPAASEPPVSTAPSPPPSPVAAKPAPAGTPIPTTVTSYDNAQPVTAPATTATPPATPAVAAIAPPPPAAAPPPAAIAIRIEGIDRDFRRFGLTDSDLRAAVAQRLQSAGYQVSDGAGGITLALVLRHTYNTVAGLYSYSTEITASGNRADGTAVRWSGGEGGAVPASDLQRIRGVFLKHVDTFVATHPAR